MICFPQYLNAMRRHAIIVLVGVIGLFCLGGRQAFASCGDYLVHGDTHQAEPGMELTAKAQLLFSVMPHKQPCHGPGCSQAPKTFEAISLPLVKFSRVQFALVGSQFLGREPVLTGYGNATDGLLLGVEWNLDLFRPPQC